MKVTHTSTYGRQTFEMEAHGIKDAFMKLSMLQDAFEADNLCGCCQSVNIRFEHRVTGENFNYYALRCNDCHAELSFGQAKKGGGLFVKRDKGTPETHGWYHYTGAEGQRDDFNQEPQYQGAPAPARSGGINGPYRNPPPAAQEVRQVAQPAAHSNEISDDDIPF